jgi:hypothetical protein
VHVHHDGNWPSAFTSADRKMIRTFSLSALFFLSIGLVLASYAQLPLGA